VALGLALTFAADGQAQPASDASTSTTAAATERARKLYVEAARLYDDGKYPQAYVAFAAAWAIKKHPSIAGNLADCEAKLGKFRDAAEHFRYIVKDVSGEVKAEDKRRAQERLDEVLKRIGVVTVTVNPGEVELALDGTAVGASPLPDSVFVDPGHHTLEGHRDGYLPTQVTFDVAAGAAQPIRLTLKPKGSDPVPLPERRSIVPGAVLGAVTGVTLAVGIGLVAVVANKHATDTNLNHAITDAHHSCVASAPNFDSQCITLQSTSSAADTLSRAEVGVLTGAGALAVGTVVYFLWPEAKPRAPTSSSVRVVPVFSTGSGGMFVSGTF
jgi:hypothetical protein